MSAPPGSPKPVAQQPNATDELAAIEPQAQAPAQSPAKPAARARNWPKEPARPQEIGGRNGPEPTRFGDWEKNGRCIDF